MHDMDTLDRNDAINRYREDYGADERKPQHRQKHRLRRRWGGRLFALGGLALLASGLSLVAIAEAANEMRAGNTRSARYFLLTGIVFAVVTFFADPQYRNLTFPQPPPFLAYILAASLLSIGLSVIGKCLRIYRIRESAKALAGKMREFDIEWSLRFVSLTPTQQVLATPEHNKIISRSV